MIKQTLLDFLKEKIYLFLNVTEVVNQIMMMMKVISKRYRPNEFVLVLLGSIIPPIVSSVFSHY